MKILSVSISLFFVINLFSQIEESNSFNPCSNGTGITTTVNFYPDKDASVGYHWGYDSEDTNYGNAAHNSPFSQPSDADITEENMGWALIDFEITGIPDTAEILSAHLNLFAYTTAISPYISGHIGDNASWVSRINEDWEELTVTWNTKPGYSELNQVAIGPSTSYDEDFIVNVTDLVKDMLLYPESSFGFSIRLQEESPTRGLMFCSSDVASESNWPMLTISYCSLPTAIEELNVNDISIYQSLGTQEIIIQSNITDLSSLIITLRDISGRIIPIPSEFVSFNGDNKISISTNRFLLFLD